MKKILTFPVLLFAFAIVLSSKNAPVRTEAVPVSGDLVEQLGGPIAKDCPITPDEILLKYNKSKTYEATLVPHAGYSEMTFHGTACHSVDLPPIDAELAFYAALRNSGATEKELQECKEMTGEYEESARKMTSEDFIDILKEAFGMSGSALGMSSDNLTKTAATLSFAADGSLFLKGAMADKAMPVDIVDILLAGADVIAAVGSLFDKVAHPIINGAAGVAGRVVFMASATYTTAKKYVEHQEKWKEFIDYINARRKLSDYQKYLMRELDPKLKKAEKLDIRFDDSCDTVGKIWGEFEIPVKASLKARFAKNCYGENDAFRGTENDDGFVAKYTFFYESDMDAFTDKFDGSNFDVAGAFMKVLKKTIPPSVWKNEVTTKFVHNATLEGDFLTMWIASGKIGEGKLVFEGPLEGNSFEYTQLGTLERVGKGKHSVTINGETSWEAWEATSTLTLNKAGIRDKYSVYHATHKGTLLSDKGTNHEEEGELFMIQETFQNTRAQMTVDFTKLVEE